MRNLTVQFVRKCRVEHLKQGCLVQWVTKPASAVAKVSRTTMIAPLQKSSSLPQITVQLSDERVFVRLAKNEQELEWGVSKTAGVVPPLPNTISLSLFTDVVCGSNCPMLKNAAAKNKDAEEFRDKCIELLPANANSETSTKVRACFYVDDMTNFALLVDGLKTLFGKPMQMANEDIRALVAAQMTKRMFDLESVVFDPSSAPAVPANKPSTYDFQGK